MADEDRDVSGGVSVLPPIENGATISAPENPNELLNDDQRAELQADLERMALLRREAEVSSANLKMA